MIARSVFAVALALALAAPEPAAAVEERLVFDVWPDDASADLVSLGIEHRDLRNLTNTADYDEYTARASLDGTRLVFSRSSFACRRWIWTSRCPSDLWTIRADGTGLTQITATPYLNEMWSSLSPDGRRIAFGATAHGSDSVGVYVIGVDGTDLRRLTPRGDDAWAPAWSPDGRRLAFPGSPGGSAPTAIWVMNADGTAPRQLTHPPPWSSDLPTEDTDPLWSPDGLQIAFSRMEADGAYEIYLINTDGTDERRLTVDPVYSSWFGSWSPDGTRIAIGRYPWNYYSGAASPRPVFVEAGIYVADADGSDPKQLYHAPFPGSWIEPSWTLVPPGGAAAAPVIPAPAAATPASGPVTVSRVSILPGRLAVSRSGIVQVRLRCVGEPCRGRVEILAGPRKLGAGSFLVAPGPPRPVGVRISSRGRRLARRRGGVRVRVVAVGLDGRSVSRRAVLRS